MNSHPEIVVEKKTSSPDEDKCVHDAKLLIPTLKDFFIKHPLINPKTFLGDAAFDSALMYKELLTGNTFGKDNHNSFIKCAQKLVSSVILISNYNVIN